MPGFPKKKIGTVEFQKRKPTIMVKDSAPGKSAVIENKSRKRTDRCSFAVLDSMRRIRTAVCGNCKALRSGKAKRGRSCKEADVAEKG